jgi:hypothetical protein
MALIQFTRNHNDQSNDNGFQFEFFCDRCGNGYQTEFQNSATAGLTTALDTASSLFGGIFSSAATVAHGARSAAWQKAHDAAFVKAVEVAQPHFHKCKRCGHWVDEDCWNGERGLCKDCAPNLEEEFSAVQVKAAVDDARLKAAQVDYVSADRFKETIAGTCPHCGAQSGGGKFCAECGQPLVAQKKFCTECGKEVKVGVKFCPECGAKQE